MLIEMPRQINTTRVLSLDATGRILDWISWQEATCLYVRGAVAWTLGEPCLIVHGGHNRLLDSQSQLELHPIVASTGRCRDHAIDPAPALTNTALFARDRHLCLYCGAPLQPRRTDPRPRAAGVQGRPRRMGKRGLRLSRLQPEKEQPHAAAGQHAVAGGAVPAERSST